MFISGNSELESVDSSAILMLILRKSIQKMEHILCPLLPEPITDLLNQKYIQNTPYKWPQWMCGFQLTSTMDTKLTPQCIQRRKEVYKNT